MVEQPDISKLRDSIIQNITDQLRENITMSVIDYVSKELKKGLMEGLSQLNKELEGDLMKRLSQQLEEKITQFQNDFLAEYTANQTGIVQNLKDTIEGLQSDVASARERKDDELAQLVSGLEVKMKSLQVEVTKKVDSELSTVQKTVSNETTRINELEAKSTEMMSSMREELNAVKGKMNLHDNSVTDLQNSLNDIRTEQRNQLKELKSESERIQSLNSSRNETIRQLILELLDNITKQDQEMDEYQFFRDWLDNIFVNETELREKVENITDITEHYPFNGTEKRGVEMGAIIKAALKAVHDNVTSTLDKFSADKTGKADFALESAGGSILYSRCSPTYDSGNTYVSLYGIRLWSVVNSPRIVIQPGVLPGQCWAFKGKNGSIFFKLSNTIHVTEFAYEHVQPSLTTNGGIESSPSNFTVFGLVDDAEEVGTHLGSYQFRKEGPPLQFFPVRENVSQSYLFIHLQVKDNNGHPNYTCLYRFRVHGHVADY